MNQDKQNANLVKKGKYPTIEVLLVTNHHGKYLLIVVKTSNTWTTLVTIQIGLVFHVFMVSGVHLEIATLVVAIQARVTARLLCAMHFLVLVVEIIHEVELLCVEQMVNLIH